MRLLLLLGLSLMVGCAPEPTPIYDDVFFRSRLVDTLPEGFMVQLDAQVTTSVKFRYLEVSILYVYYMRLGMVMREVGTRVMRQHGIVFKVTGSCK